MADWASLKPLRVHSTFMTIVVLILAGVLVLTPRHAFQLQAGTFNNEDISTAATVNAKSGLSIRSEPNISGTLLLTVPYRAPLTIIDENAAADVINGLSGKWYKVEYNGVKGFAWGSYIDK